MKPSFFLKLILPVLLLTVFASGCSKNSTEPEEEALSQAVSMEIFSELISEVFTIGFGAFKEPAHVGATTIPRPAISNMHTLTETISETVPCDHGGNISLTGTIANNFNEQGTGNFSIDLRQKPNNCGIATSQGTFLVNGNPDLRVTANMSIANWQFVGTYTFTIEGGYNWNGPGGSGGCSISMTYLYNWDNQEVSMSGTMCGYTYTY